MSFRLLGPTVITMALLIAGALFYLMPTSAYAVGEQADAQCQCQMNPQVHSPPYCPQMPCVDTTNGHATPGMCVNTGKCLGTPANGGLDGLTKALGQMMQQLMQAMQQSSQSSSSGSTPTTGCTSSYYYTSDTSVIGVDPCAMYQAPTNCTDPTASNYGAQAACTYGATATSTCTTLDEQLGLCGGTTGITSPSGSPTLSAEPTSGQVPFTVEFNVSGVSSPSDYSLDFGDGSTGSSWGLSSGVMNQPHTYTTAGAFTVALLDSSGDQITTQTITAFNTASAPAAINNVINSGTNTATSTSTGCDPTDEILGLCGTSGAAVLTPNSSGGNIVTSGNGFTILAGSTTNNSEVAGFYGSNVGGQPTGLVAQVCEERPWASGFMSFIISPSFFDSLCTARGYQVGAPPQPTVQIQQTTPAPAPTPTATVAPQPTVPTVPPQVQIWAVPASVPLDTRTTIFWNTQGVTQCTESSPDGSFSEDTLSGGAATVPLTGATTFNISCLDPNGNPVAGYVTVNLSI